MSTPHPWIDVSVPLRPGMVTWPDDPPMTIERVQAIERGDEATVSRLTLGAHTGTHMDAPAHFIAAGRTIDTLPLDAVVGPARVVGITHPTAIEPDELETLDVRAGERLLFRTRNSPRVWQTDAFVEDFVHVSPAAAAWLAARRPACVGIDYLSIAGFERETARTHRTLLEAGVWIIEGLDLTRVEPGDYDLVCLPLHLAGAEGAPARAIVRRRGDSR